MTDSGVEPNAKPPASVLFVCLGNICRSPLAEGIFRRLLNETGLGKEIHVDSAGTGAWHVGGAPDTRVPRFCVLALRATFRWLLSGTPKTHDFNGVTETAAFLGCPLGPPARALAVAQLNC